MNNEIKEILEELNKFPYGKFYGLRQEQVNQINQLLVKYSNLQEENEHLHKVNCQLRKNINNNVWRLRTKKAIEKLESIRIFGLRSDKILLSTLINESIDILNGEDK